MDKQTDDPFLAALDAVPSDDEPLTPEDEAAAEAGWQEYLRGESSSLEEVRQRLLDEPPRGRRATG